MPMIEYRCPNCSASFQKFELAGEEPSEDVCPNCGVARLQRVSRVQDGMGGCESRGRRHR